MTASRLPSTIRARQQIINRGGVHPLGADIDLDWRLAGARHIETKHTNAVLQEMFGALAPIFLV
jgi:hypothetical protein